VAKVGKPRFGINIKYTVGGRRKIWYATYEARDDAYWREKARVGKDVQYVKRIERK
jgi:hypothetical protein